MPSSPFLCTAGWNTDVIPGAQVAMLGYEACIGNCGTTKEKEPRFLVTGEPITPYFSDFHISIS